MLNAEEEGEDSSRAAVVAPAATPPAASDAAVEGDDGGGWKELMGKDVMMKVRMCVRARTHAASGLLFNPICSRLFPSIAFA